MVATPTLASDVAALIRGSPRAAPRIFHCCGDEPVDRRTLAQRTVEVFGLDGDLLDFVPPPQPWPVPYDTSLDATAIAARLGSSCRASTSSCAGWRSLACTT